jgi:Protein of unknown function (DUF4235)
MVKLLYKPVAIVAGIVGGLLSGLIFKRIWKVVGRGSDAPWQRSMKPSKIRAYRVVRVRFGAARQS